MTSSARPFFAALLGVAAVAWATATFLPVLGLASAALLFLLPVLFVSARGGTGPGLLAAIAGTGAYNFFLLPPRYTFRIHGPEDFVSALVLVAVALVTSRLATRLRARETEALDAARLSGELAELSAALSGHPAQSALSRGMALIAARYGVVHLLDDLSQPAPDAQWSSIDLAAAAWALHNGDVNGHGTPIMPAADWTFLPLAARNRRDGAIAAVARPDDGSTRSRSEIDHLAQMALLLGQCRDRDALERERQARDILVETDRLRRTLLAALSHDLRTPLTILSGQLEVLASDHPAAAEALVAAQNLERMTTNLLDAVRIEDGSLAPVFDSVDPVDAVAAVVDGASVPPGLTVLRAIPADMPFAAADPLLLHHVLANLFDNALRHARTTVAIEGQVQGCHLLLQVADDGPGVPEHERTRIFERFARGEGGDRTSGSGLGLAIVKGLADAMGMTVTVDDAPSGGARFTLSMPTTQGNRS